MFEIGARLHFDAAHCLRGYSGKCERLHGHRFEVEAVLAADEVDSIGLAFDFVDLKRLLRGLCEEMDHTNLNDLPAFQQQNASSENLARHFYRRLVGSLPPRVRLRWVTVWESPECWARYSE